MAAQVAVVVGDRRAVVRGRVLQAVRHRQRGQLRADQPLRQRRRPQHGLLVTETLGKTFQVRLARIFREPLPAK